MKIILSSMLALAIAGWPLGTQEPDPKEKPKQEEPKKQPPKQQPDETPQPKSKPEKPKQEPAPPPKQKPDEKQQQQDEKERQKQQKEEAKREKNRPPQQQNTQPDNRKQSGAQAKGQRIPPEKFRASFGREHHFRVAHRDDRRFQYSGYWFEVVEVWPAGWSFDDDCYIEEDGDDYYLVDIVHPEIRVLVIVVSG
jgi:type IV secretory pathway VirB10-like protein